MLVQEALELWLNHKSKQWSEKTRREVERYVEVWSQSIGIAAPENFTTAFVAQFSSDLPWRGATKNKARMFFRGFCRWAVAHGYLLNNPAVGWERAREVNRKKYVVLSKEEVGRLVAVLEDISPPVARLVKWAAYTGLRFGTLVQLKQEWIRNGVLEVPADAVKTRRPNRIPLHAELVNKQTCAGAGDDLDLPEFLDYQHANRAFREGIKKAGLDPATTFHDLRRTFVAWMMEAGAPQAVIMRLGGWSSPLTLQRCYQAVIPDKSLLSYLNKV